MSNDELVEYINVNLDKFQTSHIGQSHIGTDGQLILSYVNGKLEAVYNSQLQLVDDDIAADIVQRMFGFNVTGMKIKADVNRLLKEIADGYQQLDVIRQSCEHECHQVDFHEDDDGVYWADGVCKYCQIRVIASRSRDPDTYDKLVKDSYKKQWLEIDDAQRD